MTSSENDVPEPSNGASRRRSRLGDAKTVTDIGANLARIATVLISLGLGAGAAFGVIRISAPDEPNSVAVIDVSGPVDFDRIDVSDDDASAASNDTIVINNFYEPAPTGTKDDVDTAAVASDERKPAESELDEDVLAPATTIPETTSPDEGTSTTTVDEPARAVDQLNDHPVLVDLDAESDGGEYSWWKPDSGRDEFGYGENGFWFTLTIGNSGDDDIDNFAQWDFADVKAGLYEIQAWIPATWATAHVEYLMWVDENDDGRFSTQESLDSAWLDQSLVSGWASLGQRPLQGNVRIEVRDTRARDDYRVDGPVASRLAVDAIRLINVDDDR